MGISLRSERRTAPQTSRTRLLRRPPAGAGGSASPIALRSVRGAADAQSHCHQPPCPPAQEELSKDDPNDPNTWHAEAVESLTPKPLWGEPRSTVLCASLEAVARVAKQSCNCIAAWTSQAHTCCASPRARLRPAGFTLLFCFCSAEHYVPCALPADEQVLCRGPNMAAMGASAHSLQGATMQYRSAGRPMRALRGHAPAPMAVMACAAPAAAACAAPAGAGIGFKTGGWAWVRAMRSGGCPVRAEQVLS